jgi:hypothetical protein
MSGTITGKQFGVGVSLVTGAIRTWPLSKRLDVKRRICAHLAGITQANGYEFNLAPAPTPNSQGKVVPRVYRGRLVFGDNDPVPCIAVNESPIDDPAVQRADEDGKTNLYDLEVFVQGWVDPAGDNPTDPAEQLLACVKKRLSEIVQRPMSRGGRPLDNDIYMLGGRITSLRFGPGVVRPPQDGVSSWAFFYLPIVVGIGEDVSQPFVTA